MFLHHGHNRCLTVSEFCSVKIMRDSTATYLDSRIHFYFVKIDLHWIIIAAWLAVQRYLQEEYMVVWKELIIDEAHMWGEDSGILILRRCTL